MEENGGIDTEVPGESNGGELLLRRYLGRVMAENGGIDTEVPGESNGGERRY